ncbi:helix-turn-helix transcriptional regulator [Allokutzneria sp. NRRL B-24872]|uniref:helix-turn-helix transcriptional regulator n=1 Tax=Allokutzneria sp. NRRL B-24872 TaxID=1137961 RepID=UPI000A368788|nr:helix-turn-helix transcriptional regulator [Allokutzneria sp. NRRL B-24872]
MVWPLVARDTELARIGAAFTGGRGVVLTGEPGTGRSRLLDEAVDLAVGVAEGHVAHSLDGWPTTGRIVLVLDDAQLLEPEVADRVCRAAALDRVTVVVAVRNGEWVPDGISRLWLDGLAERVEVRPFDHDEIRAVLLARLGAVVDDATTEGMGLLTAGNPLLLRELTEHAVAEGSLRRIGGVWSWSGLACADGRLADVVRTRLGRLSPDEAELINMVSLAGTLCVDRFPALAQAAESLNRRGVLVVEGACVRMTYPLCGEVVAAVMPELTARRLRALLAPARRKPVRRVLPCVGTGSGLTSREREVAQYAADGLTNRDIADLLVVSVRTVENHLQRVYGKLGITTRVALAAALSA